MITSIYAFIYGLNPLLRETFRLLICFAAVVVLNVLMYLTTDLESDIREWADPNLAWFESVTLVNFLVCYYAPFFVYTIAKAWALNELRHFKSFLHFMANQVTGMFYTTGLLLFSIAYHMEKLSLTGALTLNRKGIILFLCALIFFYFWQCIKQHSSTPDLLHNHASHSK